MRFMEGDLGMRKTKKQVLAAVMACSVMVSGMSITPYATEVEEGISFVFSENGIVADKEAAGYEIDNNTLSITESGSYRVTGECSNGNIVIKKGVTGVVLTLDDISLTSESTAPICCNKSTSVEIIAKENTVNTLSDTSENANSSNTDAEGAVIKAKSGSSLTIDGTGTLNINGKAKNGIKGAVETTVTVDKLTLNVNALNNGIASDDKVIINGGTIDIEAQNEGIKSEPENTVDATTGEVTLVDTVSAGEITLNSGNISVNAAGDGIQAYKDIIVNDGDVELTSKGDGIQAANVTVNNGKMDITTNGGHTTTLSSSADSCKGLKASSTITVKGGQLTIDSADDAIHTNEYVYLLGGVIDINTGDDGAHADTSLYVGEENAENGKLTLNVDSSYEGLEAGTLYFYSGNVNVNASDDGINAAGGSSSGSDPGQGGNDRFNPGGGGRPGRPGSQNQGSTGDYSINVYGGKIYVNCNGDGLDTNGNLNISGGNVTVFSAAAGGTGSDNSPFDYDGQFALTGGTIFGAGSSQMAEKLTASVTTQKYVTSTSTVSSGKNIVVKDSASNVIYVAKAVKNVNYILYSSAELSDSESYSISATSENVTMDTTEETTTKQESETTSAGEKVTVKKITVKVTQKNSSSLTVKWTKVSGAESYEIYRADSKNGTYNKIKTINNAKTVSYTNQKLKCGKTYYYIVKSYKKVNGTKTCIGKSSAKGAKVVPEKITVSSIKSGNNKVTLKWKKLSGINGYEVYRATSKNGKYTKIATVNKASKVTYTDKKLTSGKKYYYKIRAYKKVSGKKVYGSYSTVKNVKVG